jgi:hypothetical protein
MKRYKNRGKFFPSTFCFLYNATHVVLLPTHTRKTINRTPLDILEKCSIFHYAFMTRRKFKNLPSNGNAIEEKEVKKKFRKEI